MVKAYAQLYSSLGAAVGAFLAPLLGGWMGRRWTYLILCILGLGSSSILFRLFHEFDAGFLAMVGVVGFCTASFYGWLPLYLPELFPTRVRATGQGLAFNFGRIMAAIGAWNMPALMGFFGQSYPRAGATIVLVYAIGAAAIWLAPETHGKPLPD